ncbi:DNA adenine methylase [Candidatus Poriferisocius sp.]|uniref:DNA adenine methylase n=1 Tax=Candidatus Poriferisocius sp. TaxID=3101276 RepID=UPI003B01C873
MSRSDPEQISLFEPSVCLSERAEYFKQQLITYIGNKRLLLGPIADALKQVQSETGNKKLQLFDAFSGSGVVSRLFKSYASRLVANDLEPYAGVISRCFLANETEIDLNIIKSVVESINDLTEENLASYPGIIERLYAPSDDNYIKHGERVFYTRDNARRLDKLRLLIEQQNKDYRNLLLGPLLSSASIHANTAGIFKGFYKDKDTGIGKFGGSGSDALSRIKGKIKLEVPVLSKFQTEFEVYQEDTNKLISDVGDFDLAYFDPPYNQHPYGSNYFMLNLLVDYVEPTDISVVSGIPSDWNRSLYNKKKHAFEQLSDAVARVDAKYVLLSFNDEGFVSTNLLRNFLSKIGKMTELQIKYNTFRGSRNLNSRKIHVTEHLFLVRKY